MNQPLQPLEEDLDTLRAAWSGGQPAFGTDTSVSAMSDTGLLAVTEAVAQLSRDSQALLTQVAAEIGKRSPSDLGKDGLAKKQGFLNPAHLIAGATGGRVVDAARLLAVGTATAERQSLTGETLPPVHPHVADALHSGGISVEQAGAITSMLDRVASRANPAQADVAEDALTQLAAANMSLDLLMRAVREVEARLDQDGIAPREEELRAGTSLSIREDPTGMLRLNGLLDPETGAPVKAAIEAIVTGQIRAKRVECATSTGDAGNDNTGAVVADERSIPQMQADALAMIARHALGCSRVPAAPAMAVVVRTDLDTLTHALTENGILSGDTDTATSDGDGAGTGTGPGHHGAGFGQIDGIDTPISASTVRRMASTAGIIPLVLGGDSLPLDLGRTARGFSPAQRIALAERDGGCACCGLDLAYTEAHHIRWWERDTGPTNLNNGVMLCPPCHTRIHNDGWVITVKNGQVWFTPPPHVDIQQKPRLGGKARYALPKLGDAA